LIGRPIFSLISNSIKMPSLNHARYGKDNIRVYKVEKDANTGVQTVTEMTVCVLLEGDIETS
jgi:urate oxidase